MITIDSECWSSARRFANQPELAWPRLGFGFSSDLDENLTQDGLWTYEWDADEVRSTEMAKPRRGEKRRVPYGRSDEQNRLIAIESRTDLPATVTRQRLEFAYDSRSRRIQKRVKEYNSGSSSWTTTAQIRFLYDGWNLLAEYDVLNSDALIRSHVWGLDLSGTPQGAGGVGGLLWSSQPSADYAAGFDANGNIITWIDLSDGSLAGTAEYGAFGETLVQSGVSGQLPFGFSTKYEDIETGLLYYGYRYYSSSNGRWLGRDTIEEKGGLNLGAFLGNDGINQMDYLGQSSCGVLWRRSIDPKNNSLISDVVTWLLTPHWFIETDDGEILDHAANSYGGRGGGQTDHWSATGFLILIGDQDCECFTKCLKKEAENAGCYGLFTSNCGEAKTWVSTCGGSW